MKQHSTRRFETKSLFFFILAGFTGSVFLTACSDSSKVGEEKPVSIPPASYDIHLEQVSEQGCLNLPRVFNSLRLLPHDAVLRRHTSDFELKRADGEKHAPRAKFSSVSAFAHFIYRESDARSAVASLEEVEQSDCDTVRFKNEIEGDKSFQIVKSDSPSILHLKDKDGKQQIFDLTNPREMRIKTSETTIDFCPDHARAEASSTQILSWGPARELSQQPAEVSRSYIKNMALVLNSFPSELTHLAVSEPSAAESQSVSAPTENLEALARAALEPDAQACPHIKAPPPGDEAAAPGDEAAPDTGAQPAPSATPNPGTEPGTDPLPPPPPEPTPRALPLPF